MIENFNDFMTLMMIIIMPIIVLVMYYIHSDMYKHRKLKYSKSYFDEIFNGRDDEVDY